MYYQPPPGDVGATTVLGDPGATTVMEPSSPRAEFGAHFEANYPRLVAQLCLITLNATQAQDLVQEAYARAWQRWSEIRELPDPAGWIRHMAVRGSNSRWRRVLAKFGLERSKGGAEPPTNDPQHRAVLEALAEIPPYRRRVLVLADIAHAPLIEIAELEGLDIGVVEARLAFARRELTDLMALRPPTVPPTANWEDL